MDEEQGEEKEKAYEQIDFSFVINMILSRCAV